MKPKRPTRPERRRSAKAKLPRLGWPPRAHKLPEPSQPLLDTATLYRAFNESLALGFPPGESRDHQSILGAPSQAALVAALARYVESLSPAQYRHLKDLGFRLVAKHGLRPSLCNIPVPARDFDALHALAGYFEGEVPFLKALQNAFHFRRPLKSFWMKHPLVAWDEDEE